MDAQGAIAFLETDRLAGVRFYARCGFKVTAQAVVLGTPNWWMRRLPGPRRTEGSSRSLPADQPPDDERAGARRPVEATPRLPSMPRRRRNGLLTRPEYHQGGDVARRLAEAW
jgi:hypothetical protein